MAKWFCILSILASLTLSHPCASAAELTQRDKDKSAVKGKPSPAKTGQRSDQRVLDKNLERDVLNMVDSHLPDIKVLLDQLRQKEPRQYDLAIRNLARSSRRLQSAKNRGEEAFELEVHIIQAQSAINLLIAKLKVRDNKRDRDALLEATKRFERAEIARASHELALLQSRFDKMQEQVAATKKRISEQKSTMDERIQKDFQTYLRKSGRK